MPISYSEFCALCDEQKLAHLNTDGAHLAVRFSGTHSVNLYYLDSPFDSFFCEIWVCLTGGTMQLRSFTSERYLSTYGVHLAFRFSGNYAVNVYSLHSFFCEAWVCLTIGTLQPRLFTSSEQLTPYVNLVQLPPTLGR
jgi:hypothetical protein